MKDDGGEQPLAVEDHHTPEAEHGNVRQHGDADHHGCALKVRHEGEGEPARRDHAAGGEVGRQIADQREQ
jgi:hypothetical protein